MVDQLEDFWSWLDGDRTKKPKAKHQRQEQPPIQYAAITGSGKRKKPTGAARKQILADQKDRCLYCDNRFGTLIHRARGKHVILGLNWDHFIPYAYGRTNANTNWIAACHICNGIKGCRMFDTIQEAREYILKRWEEKGYKLRWELSEYRDV